MVYKPSKGAYIPPFWDIYGEERCLYKQVSGNKRHVIMKTKLILFFLFLINISFAQKNITNLNSSLDFGDGIVLNTFLNIKQNRDNIIITSPKNADYRIFGHLKGTIARILGKSPKKGILLTINNKLVNDTLNGEMNIPMFGKLKFKGIYKNGILTGNMIQNDTLIIGTIKGIKGNRKPINYSYLYPKILEVTKKHIFSSKVLKTKEWEKSKKKIKKLLDNVQDDIELFIGFNILARNAPFSHYGIFIQEKEIESDTLKKKNQAEKDENEIVKHAVDFKEINTQTAYLKIKTFEAYAKKDLQNILPQIVNKNYKNLIIDIRDNGGGGIIAASEFAKYLVDDDILVGYFITNKLAYSGFQSDLFNTLPEIDMKSDKKFMENLTKGKGAKLIFKHQTNKIYTGNLYVLVNGNTASTCEPIVYLLKKTNKATIVGKNTMGAMLSANYFNVDNKYNLYLPIADFYTFDGIRLEGVGVTPNVETKSENALDKTLEIINNKK